MSVNEIQREQVIYVPWTPPEGVDEKCWYCQEEFESGEQDLVAHHRIPADPANINERIIAPNENLDHSRQGVIASIRQFANPANSNEQVIARVNSIRDIVFDHAMHRDCARIVVLAQLNEQTLPKCGICKNRVNFHYGALFSKKEIVTMIYVKAITKLAIRELKGIAIASAIGATTGALHMTTFSIIKGLTK